MDLVLIILIVLILGGGGFAYSVGSNLVGLIVGLCIVVLLVRLISGRGGNPL